MAKTSISFQAYRLKPGQDLYREIKNIVAATGFDAGCVVTCVGSLSQAQLRFAGASEGILLMGPFEILSLVGTLAPNGLHLHVALADSDGKVIGGHLMPGCLVFTTVEIVVGSLADIQFVRTHDSQTGFKELTILP